MEQPPKLSKEMEKHMALLREKYPEIREDLEYYIFDVLDKDGNTSEVRIHKWENIPVQVSKEAILQIPVWEVIDAQLRFSHLFSREEQSLIAMLKMAGVLV